ncbi:MAG: hypothetical protein SGILL_004469 [Bacillariaceae sp.]
MANPLDGVDWENPNLVSIIALKNPVDRFLTFVSHGRCAEALGYGKKYPSSNLTHSDWWKCAKGEVGDRRFKSTSDNYGLGVLGGRGCCQGKETDPSHLEHAKNIVERMTVVLDTANLNDELSVLAQLTNITLSPDALQQKSRNYVHASARERIGHDDVYEYLLEKNKLEIELYNWAKERSILHAPAAEVAGSQEVSPLVTDERSASPADDLTPSISPSANDFYDALSPTKKLQIDNYQNGTGLMVTTHITHHAGTHICGVLGKHGQPNGHKGTPEFACMGDGNNITNGAFPRGNPWLYDDTGPNIEAVRPFFHFISWEFSKPRKNPLDGVDWENPNLVSIITLKNPIDRYLKMVGQFCAEALGYDKKHPTSNLTHSDWWKCARGEVGKSGFRQASDNYGLRILAGNDCCNGAETSRTHLEHAKKVVERMTVVLDAVCLNDGLVVLANLTTINIDAADKLMKRTKHIHPPARERIGYDDVYEYLVEKNKLEFELYEWSKERSIVRCAQ